MDQEPPLSYRILRGIFQLLFWLFADVDAQGLERVPQEGPLLIAANHNSVFEGPLILAVIPRQRISAMAKQEYKGTLIGHLIAVVDPVYVARGEVDRAALREMLKRLKAGGALGIAPEGTRSKTGALIEGKEGAAYLAIQSGAQIVPVAVWGQEKALADLKRFKRPQMHLRVGEPFHLDSDPSLSRSENLARGTRKIMHAIAYLLPPDYRGVYAEELEDKRAVEQ